MSFVLHSWEHTLHSYQRTPTSALVESRLKNCIERNASVLKSLQRRVVHDNIPTMFIIMMGWSGFRYTSPSDLYQLRRQWEALGLSETCYIMQRDACPVILPRRHVQHCLVLNFKRFRQSFVDASLYLLCVYVCVCVCVCLSVCLSLSLSLSLSESKTWTVMPGALKQQS